MQEILQDPVFQAGIAPFIAGFVVTIVLGRARLGGLAVVAGFAVGVALVSGLSFVPLTATRKIYLLALAAPALGLGIDFVVKSGRTLALAVAIAFGALSVWVFWSVLLRMPVGDAVLIGGGSFLFVGWIVATTLTLSAQSVRAGSAALTLGLGVGVDRKSVV